MTVSRGPQGTQSSRRGSPRHKQLPNSVLRAVEEDCRSDTKKAVTGGGCRIEELCGRFCFKIGCSVEHSSGAEEERCFSYLLLHNKSAPD